MPGSPSHHSAGFSARVPRRTGMMTSYQLKIGLSLRSSLQLNTGALVSGQPDDTIGFSVHKRRGAGTKSTNVIEDL